MGPGCEVSGECPCCLVHRVEKLKQDGQSVRSRCFVVDQNWWQRQPPLKKKKAVIKEVIGSRASEP